MLPLVVCACALAIALDTEKPRRRRRTVVETVEVSHSHKCPRCGHIWSHPTRVDLSPEEDFAWHQCPKCGAEQREKYEQVMRNKWGYSRR
jgi:predicted RNA-binding Zn-ribbon protein involved in translation (DUF1610 family)